MAAGPSLPRPMRPSRFSTSSYQLAPGPRFGSRTQRVSCCSVRGLPAFSSPAGGASVHTKARNSSSEYIERNRTRCHPELTRPWQSRNRTARRARLLTKCVPGFRWRRLCGSYVRLRAGGAPGSAFRLCADDEVRTEPTNPQHRFDERTARTMDGAFPNPPNGWLGSPEERWPWTARVGFGCVGSSAAYWRGRTAPRAASKRKRKTIPNFEPLEAVALMSAGRILPAPRSGTTFGQLWCTRDHTAGHRQVSVLAKHHQVSSAENISFSDIPVDDARTNRCRSATRRRISRVSRSLPH